MKLKQLLLAAAAACLIGSGLCATSASADPQLIEDTYDWVNGNDLDRFDNWFWTDEFGSTDFLPFQADTDDDPDCAGGLCGLWAFAQQNDEYDEGQTGAWLIWPGGGSESYIDSVEIANWQFINPGVGEPHAIFGTLTHSFTIGDHFDVTTTDSGSDSLEGGTNTRAFYFGLQADDDVLLGSGRGVQLGSVTLKYGDRDDPDLYEYWSPHPYGWVNEDPFEVQVAATDQGLGVQKIAVKGDDYEAAWDGECDGTHESPCELETPPDTTVTVDPSELDEGMNVLITAAYDPTGRESDTHEMDLEVDKTRPVIDLGGTFMTAPGMVLDGPSYTLDVDATDGTVGSPNSGVVSLEASIDNVVIDSDTQSCLTQNCQLGIDPTIDPDDYSNGPHLLKVKATDKVGHVSNTFVYFEVDR